jgi:hypothetical protein
MPPEPVHAVTLACHPDTPTDAVSSMSARVCRSPGERLAVSYVVECDLDRVRVPAPRAPRPADRLWEHTCCEIFIARKGAPGYREYNFSPSGEWAAYAFEAYRARCAGEPQPALSPPQITVRGDRGTLELDASISLDGLAPRPGARLALALSAVIEDSDGKLSYWALRHPRGKPDFHHPDAFALELAATTPPAGAGTPPRAGGER